MKKVLLACLTIAVLAVIGRVPAGAAPAACFSEEIADIGTHWGRGDMAALARMGIMSGYPEKEGSGGKTITRYYFRPDWKVTRAEFAVILAGALGLEGDEEADAFADGREIPGWAAKPVGALHARGIIKGFPVSGGGFEFRPWSLVTRAELAAMFAGAAGGGPGTEGGHRFPDVPRDSWYSGAVARAYSLGIIRGRPNGLFAPRESASRAEVAAMTVRLLERDVNGAPPDLLLAEVVGEYYKSLPAALGRGDASGLLALADGAFYLGLTRGGAGIWENIPGANSNVVIDPGDPEVVFKSGRLARLRCASGFTEGGPGNGSLAGRLTESLYLRRIGDHWKIYHVEVEDVRLE